MEIKIRKMNIVHIVPDIGIGGLSKVVLDICRNLDKKNYNISVYAIRKYEEEFTPDFIKAGINVAYGLKKGQNKGYGVFLKIAKYLKIVQADIVHTHNTAAFLDGTIGAMLADVPVRIHTDHARLYPDKTRYQIAEKIMSKYVAKIVAVSEHTKQDLIKYQRISEDKIVVIPNGIDLGEIKKIVPEDKKRELGIKYGAPVIGLGVRLEEQKGIKYLIRAMPYILNKYPETVCLIAGEGSKRYELEEEAKKHGLKDSIKFLGVRRDMTEILQIIDIYVLPSIWEGLPLVVLEAMAAGKAIIATNVGGNSTAIINEYNGLLIPSRNVEAIADGILRFLKEPNFAAEMSKNAYRTFNERFTVDKMVNQYEMLYADLHFNSTNTKNKVVNVCG